MQSANVNITSYSKILVTELADLFPGIKNEELQIKEFEKIFSPILSKFLKDRFVDELKDIESSYITSIKMLTPVDPVISYYLSGKTTSVKQVSQWISLLVEGMKPHIPNQSELERESVILHKVLENQVFLSTLNEIKELILELAAQVGIHTKRRVSKIFSNSLNREGNNLEIKAIIRELLKETKAAFENR